MYPFKQIMSSLISKIQFTRNQRKILKSALEPPSTEWLWLKTQNGVSTLYDYVNGKWTAVGGGNGNSGTTPVPGPSGNYVTTTTLNVKLSSLSKEIDLKLKELSESLGHLDLTELKADINDIKSKLSKYITTDQLDAKIAEKMNGYQLALKAGNLISIDSATNTISVDITPVVDKLLNEDSNNPVANSAVSAKIGDIQSDINTLKSNKQDKLSAGSGISINGNVISATGGGGGGSVITVDGEQFIGGMGPYNGDTGAVHYAQQHPNTLFQWILVDVDPVSSVSFRKIIWHVGNGEFIDALGAVISL